MPGVTSKSVLALLNNTSPGAQLLDGSDLATIVQATASGKGALIATPGGGVTVATKVTTSISEFTTVASANDSCVLGPAIAGAEYQVINSGAQNLRVYANPANLANPDANGNGQADLIIAAAGGAGAAFITVAANATGDLICSTLGRWKSLNQ